MARAKSTLRNVESDAREPVAKDVLTGKLPTASAKGARLTLLDHIWILFNRVENS